MMMMMMMTVCRTPLVLRVYDFKHTIKNVDLTKFLVFLIGLFLSAAVVFF